MNMWAYCLLFVLCSFAMLLDALELKNEQKKPVVVAVGILLVLFSGLRGAVDNDYTNYVEIYKSIISSDIHSLLFADTSAGFFDVEPGYRLFNKLVAITFGHYQFVFLGCALLGVGISVYCFQKLSPYPLLSVVLYLSHTYLLRDMMQIRAGVAAALCLYSLLLVKQGKNVRFFLVVIGAALFHSAAITFLLIWIANKYAPTIRVYVMVLVTCVLVGAIFPFGALVRQLPEFDLLYKVQGYANNEYSDALGLLNPVLIKQLALTVVCLFFYRRLCNDTAFFSVLFTCYFISTCWLLIFNDFGIIAGRIATFFSVTEVVLVPVLAKSFIREYKWSVAIVYIVLLFYAFTFFYTNLYIRENFRPYTLGSMFTGK